MTDIEEIADRLKTEYGFDEFVQIHDLYHVRLDHLYGDGSENVYKFSVKELQNDLPYVMTEQELKQLLSFVSKLSSNTPNAINLFRAFELLEYIT